MYKKVNLRIWLQYTVVVSKQKVPCVGMHCGKRQEGVVRLQGPEGKELAFVQCLLIWTDTEQGALVPCLLGSASLGKSPFVKIQLL